MKKLVIVLFVLCSALFITNPVIKDVFAENNNEVNNHQETVIEKDTLESTSKENTDNKTLETNDTVKTSIDTNEKTNIEQYTPKEDTTSSNDIDVPKTENTDVEIKEDISNTDQVINNENSNKPVEEVDVVKILTKEDALNLLLDMNPNLVYAYQGDENTFPALKEKGLSGYVFLPNVDTDLGYFVDKNTSSIYYFHPSGYLEKIK